MVSEIHHVAVSVSDLERSIPFYRDGVGLRMTLDMRVGNDTMPARLRVPSGATGRAVYFQGPSRIGQVELIQWDVPAAPAEWHPKRPGEPGVFSLSFHVELDEMQEIYQRMTAMGVDCYHPPAGSVLPNYGPLTMFMCEDPDGIQVEFINLPTREQILEFRAATAAAAGAGATTPDPGQ